MEGLMGAIFMQSSVQVQLLHVPLACCRLRCIPSGLNAF